MFRTAKDYEKLDQKTSALLYTIRQFLSIKTTSLLPVLLFMTMIKKKFMPVELKIR